MYLFCMYLFFIFSIFLCLNFDIIKFFFGCCLFSCFLSLVVIIRELVNLFCGLFISLSLFGVLGVCKIVYYLGK